MSRRAQPDDSGHWNLDAPWRRRGDPCPRCTVGKLRLAHRFSDLYFACPEPYCGWTEILGAPPHPNFKGERHAR